MASVAVILASPWAQVREYEAQDQEAAASAADAEDVASTAMKAAERAVREEMEAAAVTKETKKALEKAIVDLKDLGIGFAEEDDRAANERAKAVAENKVDFNNPADWFPTFPTHRMI